MIKKSYKGMSIDTLELVLMYRIREHDEIHPENYSLGMYIAKKSSIWLIIKNISRALEEIKSLHVYDDE